MTRHRLPNRHSNMAAHRLLALAEKIEREGLDTPLRQVLSDLEIAPGSPAGLAIGSLFAAFEPELFNRLHREAAVREGIL